MFYIDGLGYGKITDCSTHDFEVARILVKSFPDIDSIIDPSNLNLTHEEFSALEYASARCDGYGIVSAVNWAIDLLKIAGEYPK